jgi:peptidoglycan hydrolase-like protein with peptidoglycan-binding domain
MASQNSRLKRKTHMRQAQAPQDAFWDEDYEKPAPQPRRERAPPPIPRDEYYEREERAPARSKRQKTVMERLFAFVKARPSDSAAIGMASVFCVAIAFNMLVLQKKAGVVEEVKVVKQEPATIPVVQQAKIIEPSLLDKQSFAEPKPRANPVEEVQRELARRNIYQDTVDGRMGSKTQLAIREFQRKNGLKVDGEISEGLIFALRPSAGITKPVGVTAPPKHSTLTDLVEQVQDKPEPRREPSPRMDNMKRMVAVQKALNQMAFGPIITNGVMSAETRSAILRFEQDRNLTPRGEVTEKLVKQMEAVLGTRIE